MKKFQTFMRSNKNIIFFMVTTLAMMVMIWYGMNNQIDFGFNQNEGVTFPSGRVVEVVSDETTIDESGIRMGRQDLLVELLSGDHRGKIVETQNILFIEQGVYAREGERLIIYFEQMPGTMDYFARVHSHDRAMTIYVIVILFFGLLATVFGKAGVRSAFGLVFTFVIIIFLLIPWIVSGGPPALLTLGVSLCITMVSLFSVMGFEKKTYVSIAGTSIGILFYCLFYVIISTALHVTGFNVSEMSSLITIGFNTYAGISELLFCAILIASLGAVMDVSVSLSSVIAELHETNPEANFKALFRSGMKIGRDLIGSSSNTLILAFTGTFLISLILFRVNNFSYNMLINRVDIAVEVLRAISASVAMVLCAPATAIIGAYAHSSWGKRSENS